MGVKDESFWYYNGKIYPVGQQFIDEWDEEGVVTHAYWMSKHAYNFGLHVPDIVWSDDGSDEWLEIIDKASNAGFVRVQQFNNIATITIPKFSKRYVDAVYSMICDNPERFDHKFLEAITLDYERAMFEEDFDAPKKGNYVGEDNIEEFLLALDRAEKGKFKENKKMRKGLKEGYKDTKWYGSDEAPFGASNMDVNAIDAELNDIIEEHNNTFEVKSDLSFKVLSWDTYNFGDRVQVSVLFNRAIKRPGGEGKEVEDLLNNGLLDEFGFTDATVGGVGWDAKTKADRWNIEWNKHSKYNKDGTLKQPTGLDYMSSSHCINGTEPFTVREGTVISQEVANRVADCIRKHPEEVYDHTLQDGMETPVRDIHSYGPSFVGSYTHNFGTFNFACHIDPCLTDDGKYWADEHDLTNFLKKACGDLLNDYLADYNLEVRENACKASWYDADNGRDVDFEIEIGFKEVGIDTKEVYFNHKGNSFKNISPDDDPIRDFPKRPNKKLDTQREVIERVYRKCLKANRMKEEEFKTSEWWQRFDLNFPEENDPVFENDKGAVYLYREDPKVLFQVFYVVLKDEPENVYKLERWRGDVSLTWVNKDDIFKCFDYPYCAADKTARDLEHESGFHSVGDRPLTRSIPAEELGKYRRAYDCFIDYVRSKEESKLTESVKSLSDEEMMEIVEDGVYGSNSDLPDDEVLGVEKGGVLVYTSDSNIEEYPELEGVSDYDYIDNIESDHPEIKATIVDVSDAEAEEYERKYDVESGVFRIIKLNVK